MKYIWWGCPRWLCKLLSNHAMTRRWANYNTDHSGSRCNCGRFYNSDDNPKKVYDEIVELQYLRERYRAEGH